MNLLKNDDKVLKLGLLTFIGGLILRFNAGNIAWPSEYRFSGLRENTVWAIREVAISEVSTAIYVFGLLIILLVIAKHLFCSNKDSEGSVEDTRS